MELVVYVILTEHHGTILKLNQQFGALFEECKVFLSVDEGCSLQT